MDHFKLSLCTSLILNSLISLVLSYEPIVETSKGKVKGILKELNQNQYTAFYGIPYAAAPVGELRFKPPQEHEGWGDTIRDAVKHGPACPQPPDVKWENPAFPSRLMQLTDDEDCLLLNVFVPGHLSKSVKESLPVIVFIHGGGFAFGSSLFEIGDAFVTQAEQVIMVTFQYRLGVLGFLTSGDDLIAGNLGFRDQNFALKWVRENIAQFGGDPNHVTICGQSAGGESILAHMISPMSAGLFHKASSQSPPAAWIYPPKEKVSDLFREYVKSMGCDGSTPEAVDCLRMKPWQELFSTTISTDALVQRVIDGKFITDEPRNIWANKQYNKADLMFGVTSDDGKLLVDYVFAQNFSFATNRSRDLEILNGTINFLLTLQLSDKKDWMEMDKIKRYGKYLLNRDGLSTMIKGRYLDSKDDPLDKARGILDFSRDNLFMIFGFWIANQIAKDNGNVYVYYFEHPTELLELNHPGGVRLGAPHGSEMPYQFGYGLTDADTIKMTEEEISLTHSMIQAWTSFAAGKPSYLTMDGEKIDWPKYTLQEPNILSFDTDISANSVRDGQKWNEVLDFWLAIESLADWGEIEDTMGDATKSRKEEL